MDQPKKPSSPGLERVLELWRSDPTIAASIASWQVDRPQSARTEPAAEIDAGLAEILSRQGIHSLYSHQIEAFQLFNQGNNLAVATGTASGKSLCYQLPILSMLQRDNQATSLLLFPTKALTYDQRNSFAAMIPAESKSTLQVYDGDTPSHLRAAIRRNARVLLTNPDMLHTAILPHHTLWAEFFRGLNLVVIDEIHVYRGVFGSHIANLIRRLKRICAFYSSSPRFILTSATISNAREHSERLIESQVYLIDQDGAPHGERNFILYNPPVVNQELGIRRSAVSEGIRLAGDLIFYDIQTLIFSQTRRQTEIAVRYLRENHAGIAGDIFAYRSGYLPGERREIERRLKSGEARAVTATNALELGVDIGSMDAVVILGYPGSIAANRQQSGRAGRKSGSSVSVLVASANPIDQFLIRHPEYLLARSPEKALINPDNPLILLQHIRCAAFELPFRQGEFFGRLPWEQVEMYLQALEELGETHLSRNRFFWTADEYPAEKISLRSTAAGTVSLHVEEEERLTTIGEVDWHSAHWLVHPGAIYLHQASTYLVKSLDLEEKRAILEPVSYDYYTEPRQEIDLQILETHQSAPVESGTCSLGEVMVASQLIGYRKIRWYTHEQLGGEEITLPPTELQTMAYWLVLDETVVKSLEELNLWTNAPNDYGPAWRLQRSLARRRDNYTCQNCGAREQGVEHHVHHKIPFRQFTSAEVANQLDNLVTLCPACHKKAEGAVRMRSGLAGLTYVLSQLAPLLIMCDVSDLGSHFDPQSALVEGAPVLFLYDKVPAGIGLCDEIYQRHGELMRNALDLVEHCACQEGCPSCVGVGGENGSGGKRETLALLALLNGKPLQV
jgi:DEAD/DEAH box helicase domain-containing protein